MSASFPPRRFPGLILAASLLPTLLGATAARAASPVAVEILGSDRRPIERPNSPDSLGFTTDPDRTSRLKPRSPLTPPPVAAVPDEWWSQGSASPVAVALGSAEGTRRPDGGKNPAYYWHTDPGNGANNFGTFSWQHLPPEVMEPVVRVGGAAAKRDVSAQLGLAESADRVAFARVAHFHEQLRDRALEKEMALTLRELLNGLDLANQSPLAGLSPMGYLDRLAQMRTQLSDADAQILEARVYSFWHPRKNRWDAPGLGNTYATIRRDQARRMAAIDAAIAEYLNGSNGSGIRGEAALSMASPNPTKQASDRASLDFDPAF